MKKNYCYIFNTLISIFLILFIISCGGKNNADNVDNKNSEYGSISSKINWHNSYPPEVDNNHFEDPQVQSNILGLKAVSLNVVAPIGVVIVKISVSASDMSTITRSFAYDDHHGRIGGIPIGSNRTFTCEGLDSAGTVTYQGVSTGIVIEQNITTTVSANAYWVEELPVAPSNLAATAVSSNQINLTWTDNSTIEDGFKIERKIGLSGLYSQITAVNKNVISYEDTGLNINTAYYYRITAYKNEDYSNYSNYSNEASSTTPAVTLTVCSSGCGYTSIQDAIDAAGNENTLILVDDGIYFENINFSSKAVILRSKNGPDVTVINGGANGSVVTFNSGEGVGSVLYGFGVTNGGGTSGVSGSTYGGGIYCKTSSSPQITNCIIRNNKATSGDPYWAPGRGGGIYCEDTSSPQITNCIISRNSVTSTENGLGEGGGIACSPSSSPSITNCIINNNESFLGGGISGNGSSTISKCTINGNSANAGGGVRCYGSSMIANCTINENSAGFGGGISCASTSSPTITNCIINGNTATGFGGGVNHSSANVHSITACTITGNTADYGGGICSAGSLKVINCIISGNLAMGEAGAGGGIYHSNSLYITTSTICGNSADFGGGVYFSSSSSYPSFEINNSILWWNVAGGAPNSIYAEEQVPVLISYSDIEGNYTGTGIINVDPLFVDMHPASEAPTSEGDYHLHAGSPCIDVVSSLSYPTTDIDGDNRPHGTGFDIGADEYIGSAAISVSPSNLSVFSKFANQITLTWYDNSCNENGFEIERKTGTSGTYSLIKNITANITIYQDIGLNADTIYYYRVRAYNIAGVSSYSNEVNTTTLPLVTPPTTPNNLSATTTSFNQIDLNWTDNSANEDGFIIAQKVGTSGTYKPITTVHANITSYQDTDLIGSTTYYYRINAYRWEAFDLTYSSYSNEANTITALTPPSGLLATTISHTRIDLQWEDHSDYETGFKIERKTGDSGSYSQITMTDANIISYQDTNLNVDTTYFYRINAYNDYDVSDYSNEANATTGIIITVGITECDYHSIQNAINGSSDGDTIFIEDGTYHENIDFDGKAIMMQAINGADYTIIDGSSLGSVVSFNSNEGTTSVLDGFRIQKGSALSGGGIYCNSSSPIIANCIISGNKATSGGGGIYCVKSSPTITDSIINGNSVDSLNVSGGGGIYCNQASPSITGCTVSNNSVMNAHGLNTGGGGIYCYKSFPKINKCTISGNKSSYYGGGIYYYSYSSPSITNCTISGNSALSGGGIYCNSGSSPTIVNCTISGNQASFNGGGIYCWDSSPIIKNAILWGDIGGGIPNEIILDGSTLSLEITYSNIEGGDPDNPDLPYPGTGNINADPLFVDSRMASQAPTSNGNYHLLSGSPCVDNGTNSGTPSADIDGDSRPQGATFDIGSDEYTGMGTGIPPPAPSNLSAISFSSDRINLSWTDNSTNEDGFKVERKEGSDGIWSKIATVENAFGATYHDVGLSYGTTYYYRVRAFNIAGKSLYSNEVYATTYYLETPHNFYVNQVYTHQVNLKWTYGTIINTTGFKIERKTGSSGAYSQIATLNANIYSYIDAGLISGTHYYYRIKAYNSEGDSNYSITDATTHY